LRSRQMTSKDSACLFLLRNVDLERFQVRITKTSNWIHRLEVVDKTPVEEVHLSIDWNSLLGGKIELPLQLLAH